MIPNTIIDKAEILGFKTNIKKNNNMNYLTIYSEETPTKKTIKKLLEVFDEGYHIRFFDYFHKQISDPGAYINVVKDNDSFLFHKGNHGWSSEWITISTNNLVTYIVDNWNYGDPSDEYKNYIIIDDYEYGFPYRNK
ncbi:MAG: hypothetical protein ACK5LC_01940 [Coprobacillaceae bacterium]